jgi:hypothetical protein
MSWTPPQLPSRQHESILAYWQAILAIPTNEPSAEILREMASQRLVELQAIRTLNAGKIIAEK